jgi:hypothetical protein
MRTVVTVAFVAFCAAFPANALATSAGQIFPSNLYTQRDHTQLTGLRVDLPQPNCTTNPSDCADVAVLDTLDGFNIQPRISIPFSGPIDLSTVSSKTVFMVGGGEVVGINQIEWEPATNTLHVESDQQLKQDTTYLLVVTRGIKDSSGKPIDGLDTKHGRHGDYGDDVERALPWALGRGLGPVGIADASVFTTQTITAISKKIMRQLQGGPATFTLGTHGERTVFPVSGLTGIVLHRQVGTAPTFADSALPLGALQIYPGSVGTVAFGSYASPDYENSDEVIPAVGTRTGVPAVQSVNHLGFTLFEPAGTPPAGGWPTVIFGHGFTDSKDGAPWVVASSLAHAGLASIAINVVGHGGGALGTYTVSQGTSTVTLPSAPPPWPTTLIAIVARPACASDDATTHGAPSFESVKPWPKITVGQPPAGGVPAGSNSVKPRWFTDCTAGTPVLVPTAGITASEFS